jgi:hypothetical protein
LPAWRKVDALHNPAGIAATMIITALASVGAQGPPTTAINSSGSGDGRGGLLQRTTGDQLRPERSSEPLQHRSLLTVAIEPVAIEMAEPYETDNPYVDHHTYHSDHRI